MVAVLLAVGLAIADLGRHETSFNDGWEFCNRDGNWERVTLPHDCAIREGFDASLDSVTGDLRWKRVVQYRRVWNLNEKLPDRRYALAFGGVMGQSKVFVNGEPVGGGEYGYLGFQVDASPYLHAGSNLVTVVADTTMMRSRWYPGAGIYRNVRLVETGLVRLGEDSLAVVTENVLTPKAKVRVTGEVVNGTCVDASCKVTVRLLEPNGACVAVQTIPATAPAQERGKFAVELEVENPVLWQIGQAALYQLKVSIVEGAKDTLVRRIGLREPMFTADDGFHLNGKRVQLKGVNLHSDLGPLGMAFDKSAARRQLTIMREMGVNAIRTSHNCPAEEFLDLCDEMGFFVWDECFDKWDDTTGRGDLNLEDFVDRNLRTFVRRDRLHPSVMCWSIGNEIPPSQGLPPEDEFWAGRTIHGTTAARCARFRKAVLAEDRTRPVGAACCFTTAVEAGDLDPLDLTGWNYRAKYREMKKRAPMKPTVYTEAAASVSDQGYYPEKAPTNICDFAWDKATIDSMDRNAAGFGDLTDVELTRMADDRYCCGMFVWAGIDYLGEPTPYGGTEMNGHPIPAERRWRSGAFGICDLTVCPKDRYWLYRSVWNENATTLHIAPSHWNFGYKKIQSETDSQKPDTKNSKPVIPVYVYTSAPEAELFLNGVSLGRRRKAEGPVGDGPFAELPRYRLMWEKVIYAPGELQAVAYDSAGRTIGRTTLMTAEEPVAVSLVPEKPVLVEGELLFVNAGLKDKLGTVVPDVNTELSYTLDGPAEIVAVANADPGSHKSFYDTASHPLNRGRGVVILRRTGKGLVTLTATAQNLIPAQVGFK